MEKELDNNVLKLLACVKYKHPKINDIISDPEIYCLLKAWLDGGRKFIRYQALQLHSSYHMIFNFQCALDNITNEKSSLEDIKKY